jgi:succinate dehydrogenase / fumarate reductase, membrane anchor subunit
MGSGTGIGRVRGLGSAKQGSGHWWLQRVTAVGNIMLMLWFILSLLLLPSLDRKVVISWLASPLSSVLMILLVINVFWHFRLGLQVIIEDYVHGGMRLVTMAILHLWTFIMGGFALYAIFKIAFIGAPA